MTRASGHGELELVEWLGARFRYDRDRVPIAIGDDMAEVRVGETSVFITTDIRLDGVHFRCGRDPWDLIGRKALACGLSDCAAMAVRPIGATVSLALSADTAQESARDIFEGLARLADEFDCPVVGGDTTSWDHPLAIEATVLGQRYPEHGAVRRSAAAPGDVLFVTGKLGGSLLGKHLSFTPRVAEAHALAKELGEKLHAMIDLSDGLSLDLHRLCRASACGAELDERWLEAAISDDAVRAGSDGRRPLDHALSDGEDFELLFAASLDARDPLEIAGVTAFPVGRIVPSGYRMRTGSGRMVDMAPTGYEHRFG